MKGSEKREARRQAARLWALGRVGIAPRSDEERLREATQSLRNEDAYAAAAGCTACTEARAASNDPTALCPRHLMLAMGV